MEHGRIRPPTASGAHLESDVMVPMRDGVYLATNILYPVQDVSPLETPLPVLLQRTPYNKSSQPRMEEARNFASQGYVSVIQDCRGRYASQGGFSKYVDEGKTVTTPSNGWPGSPGATARLECMDCHTQRIPRPRWPAWTRLT
jgi:hypothetical protein